MGILAVALTMCFMGSVPTLVMSKSYDGGMKCYACTSYIEQCKNSVRHGDGDVFKTRCNTKCFVRHGEDGAIYRGCFDGFVGVPNLLGDYVGCKNMSWPFENSLTWCLCDDDLCNGASMDQMNHFQSSSENAIGNEVIHKYDVSKAQKMARYAKEGGEEQQDNLGDFQDHYQMEETNHGANFEEEVNTGDARSNLHEDEQPSGSNYDGSYNAQEHSPPRQEYEFRNIYFPPGPNSPDFDAHRSENLHANAVVSDKVGDAFLKPRSYQNEFHQEDESRSNQGAAGYTDHVARDMYYPHENEGFQLNFPPPYAGYNLDIEEMKPLPFPRDLADRIPCGRTGFYQNPDDCRTFVACIRDPRSVVPIMHLMRCPEGLVWDNTEKICKELSSTCNVAVSGDYGQPSQFGPHDVQDNTIDPLGQFESKNRYEEVDMFPNDFYDNDNDYHGNQVQQQQPISNQEQVEDHSNSYLTEPSYSNEQNNFQQQQANNNNGNYQQQNNNNYQPSLQSNYKQSSEYQEPQQENNGYGGSDAYQQQQNYQSEYTPQAQPPPAQAQINYPTKPGNYPQPNGFPPQENNNNQQQQQPNNFQPSKQFKFKNPFFKSPPNNKDQGVVGGGNHFQTGPKPPPRAQYTANNFNQNTNEYQQQPNNFQMNGGQNVNKLIN